MHSPLRVGYINAFIDMSKLGIIDVYFSVQGFQEDDVRGKTVVIIDVLRASSSMIQALDQGAQKVIPVEDMAAAGRIAQTMESGDYLLCGEKDGVKIDGYHLGNSPLEYTQEVVQNKTLIFNTTNGTKAIKKAALANQIYIGTFLNMSQIVNMIHECEDEVVLICSGWRGKQSLEDTLCAGAILSELNAGKAPTKLKDGAKIAYALYQQYGDFVLDTVFHSDHAYRLRDMVSEDDISFCCQTNTHEVLPYMKEGIISVKKN